MSKKKQHNPAVKQAVQRGRWERFDTNTKFLCGNRQRTLIPPDMAGLVFIDEENEFVAAVPICCRCLTELQDG